MLDLVDRSVDCTLEGTCKDPLNNGASIGRKLSIPLRTGTKHVYTFIRFMLCIFLSRGVKWEKKSKDSAYRGFVADTDEVPEARPKTKEQKLSYLELMLSHTAKFVLFTGHKFDNGT